MAQLQKDVRIYECAQNLNNYDHDMITNHRFDCQTDGIVQTDFGLYGSTPYGNNRFHDSNNSMMETPYELTKSLTGYPHNLHTQQSLEESTFGENYPYNYETPSNHYNTHPKKYSNNGYINTYENNVQNKQIHEFGGGDNATSHHANHCYKTSPNGKPIDEETAYKTAEYDSKEQLQVLYQIRKREIDRLTEELQQLKQEKEDEKNKMSRKLSQIQTEVSAANISKNQAHHALGKN